MMTYTNTTSKTHRTIHSTYTYLVPGQKKHYHMSETLITQILTTLYNRQRLMLIISGKIKQTGLLQQTSNKPVTKRWNNNHIIRKNSSQARQTCDVAFNSYKDLPSYFCKPSGVKILVKQSMHLKRDILRLQGEPVCMKQDIVVVK